jgi:hypothetical protein
MESVLDIERQIDELPKEEFSVLAAWFLERAEEEGLLNACTDAEEGGLAEDAEADSVIAKLRLRAGSQ